MSKTQSEAMAPCPFCGGNVMNFAWQPPCGPNDFRHEQVRCSKCFACGPASGRLPDTLQSKDDLIVEAKKLWNTRPTPTAAPVGLREFSGEIVAIGDDAKRHLEIRDRLNRAIYAVLHGHRMGNMVDDEGYGYPLLDLMSNPAPADIGTGEMEMVSLADDIAAAVDALTPPVQEVETPARTEEGEDLLNDANSWYSQAQLDEIADSHARKHISDLMKAGGHSGYVTMNIGPGKPDTHGRYCWDNLRFTADELVEIVTALTATPADAAPGIEPHNVEDYAELHRLYNFADDDSLQFTRWNMLTAIRHGKRISADSASAGEVETAEAKGMDAAADFCIQTLAKALGVDDWEQADGSETWDGDVAGTIYNVLKAGNVYDDEDGRVAQLSDAQPSGQAMQALRMAKDLIDTIEQTPNNVWHVAADDPETAVGDTYAAVLAALSSDGGE